MTQTKKDRASSSSSWGLRGLALHKAGIFASHMDLNFPLLKCSSLSVENLNAFIIWAFKITSDNPMLKHERENSWLSLSN
jgi:hypothetical protein